MVTVATVTDCLADTAEKLDHNSTEKLDHNAIKKLDHNSTEKLYQNAIKKLDHNLAEKLDHNAIEKLDHNLTETLDHNAIEKLDHNLTETLDHNAIEKLDQHLTEKLDHNAIKKLDQNLAEKLDHNAIEKLDHNLTETLDHNAIEKLDHNLTEKLDHNAIEKLDQNLTETLDQNSTEKCDKNLTIELGQNSPEKLDQRKKEKPNPIATENLDQRSIKKLDKEMSKEDGIDQKLTNADAAQQSTDTDKEREGDTTKVVYDGSGANGGDGGGDRNAETAKGTRIEKGDSKGAVKCITQIDGQFDDDNSTMSTTSRNCTSNPSIGDARGSGGADGAAWPRSSEGGVGQTVSATKSASEFGEARPFRSIAFIDKRLPCVETTVSRRNVSFCKSAVREMLVADDDESQKCKAPTRRVISTIDADRESDTESL